jgi:putative hydrolase of the HAD superfamily
MPAPYARELQARHAFLSYFQAGVFSGDVGVSKPDAAIYDLAVAASGRAKGSLLFVDDLAENIAVAESLGWQGGIVFKSAEQVGKALEVMGIL